VPQFRYLLTKFRVYIAKYCSDNNVLLILVI